MEGLSGLFGSQWLALLAALIAAIAFWIAWKCCKKQPTNGHPMPIFGHVFHDKNAPHKGGGCTYSAGATGLISTITIHTAPGTQPLTTIQTAADGYYYVDMKMVDPARGGHGPYHMEVVVKDPNFGLCPQLPAAISVSPPVQQDIGFFESPSA